MTIHQSLQQHLDVFYHSPPAWNWSMPLSPTFIFSFLLGLSTAFGGGATGGNCSVLGSVGSTSTLLLACFRSCPELVRTSFLLGLLLDACFLSSTSPRPPWAGELGFTMSISLCRLVSSNVESAPLRTLVSPSALCLCPGLPGGGAEFLGEFIGEFIGEVLTDNSANIFFWASFLAPSR